MQQNNKATVALGAGIAVVVLQILVICLGWIPIINLIVILLVPLLFIADITAVVAGFLGLKEANALGGLGKGSAIAGLCIGGAHLLLTALGVVVGALLGGLSLIMGALG
jgi:hypothetical protein